MVDQESQNELIELARVRLSRRAATEALTREEISRVVDQFLGTMPEWKERTSRESAISQLSTIFSTFIGEESVLVDSASHKPWLNARRSSVEWRFWDRYRRFLVRRHIPELTVNALDRITDRTLELLGDPADSVPFNRRGMVVGDVQAGKTSNYTGLICKAADAGYKVIIVLAGMHNNLRSQTQIRLDEGFVGKVSVPIGETPNRFVGVGYIDRGPIVNWATNRTERGDFNRRVKDQFGVHPGGHPLLFVVKKVKSVLEGVLAWIETTGNSQGQNGRRFVGTPLLMVDDEADNASIDTRSRGQIQGDAEYSPSAINSAIRRILGRFDQAAYVGYTATPFANIFIHPDAQTNRELQDLFPRDFIINIPSPEDYIGPARLFGLSSFEDDEEPVPGLPLIRRIADHADSSSMRESRGWMPPAHKNEHRPLYNGEDRVPPSLERAITCFALAVAARRARGQEREHNSMLVHVTRFQAVQRRVVQQVQHCVDTLRNNIRYGGSTVLESLEKIWLDEFQDLINKLDSTDCLTATWGDVVNHLRSSVETIQIREINGTSADVLDYEMYRDSGLNVVAVGGDKLSRGLTLEGLSISYFLRGSRMYDTLMQMGRWFGYKFGYLDLCRLFTTSDLVDWYEHITLASEELRREFDRMEMIRGTPREFGLKVRSHPTLMVTSGVKMRNGTELQVSFAGDVSETTVFHTNAESLNHNFQAVDSFIGSLGNRYNYRESPEQSRGRSTHRWRGSHFWADVPSELVLDLLDRFRTHEDASRARSSVLARYISRQNQLNELTDWNVLLVSGEGEEQIGLGNCMVSTVLRQPKGGYGEEELRAIRTGERFVIRRLLNPRDEGVDIGEEGYRAALEETIRNPPKKRSRLDHDRYPTKPAEVNLRKQRQATTGLLLLYPLAREITLSDRGEKHKFLDIPQHVIGFGISFPDSKRAQAVSYVVNSIYGVDSDGEGDGET